MPLSDKTEIISLGEGGTPLFRAPRLGEQAGLENLWIKDESTNPTDSFKARGLSAAVTKALEIGATTIAIPTAGNAGSAAAAYAARAGLECVVVMPADTTPIFKKEVQAFGARLIECDGLIDECAKIVAKGKQTDGWYDVSTLKEPYRVEGKKTMGIEIAEQMGWKLPDVVVYPTGGGTGLLGMWKAWSELQALGWIDSARPRMYAVQPVGCSPVVNAFNEDKDRCEKIQGASTCALGLRVPRPFADEWILEVLRRSNGGALAVTDEQMLSAASEMSREEGVLASPEGGATWAAIRILLEKKLIDADERIVIINTASAYKYI
jgi:threonine synthase